MIGVPDPTPLVVLSRSEATRPLLAAGLRASAIVGGGGDLAVRLDTRGGSLEWGGVYGEGIRLTGAWTIGVRDAEVERTLPETLTSLSAFRHGVVSVHDAATVRLRQSIAPVDVGAAVPAVGRRIELSAIGPMASSIRIRSTFAPFLAPVLVEGIRPYLYNVATVGDFLRVTAHGFGLVVLSDPRPSLIALDAQTWPGGERTGELREIALEYSLEIPAGETRSISWVIAGGAEGILPTASETIARAFVRPSTWMAAAAAVHEEWVGRTPHLSFAGLPTLERAYDLARGALRQLYHVAEPELTGLVAGFPWYCAIWGRDLGWMLPAVAWLGDREWADRSIRSILRYQAKSSLAILGAVRGEVPMQLSGGPLFFFGTSDSTLYYPSAIRQLVDVGAPVEAVAELRPSLDLVEEWIAAKTDPSTGLLTNGGEVGEIRTSTQGAGTVHFGFDAVDTTIWDSTDRRDHAIDIQVLHIEALRSLGRLRELLGDVPRARALRDRADRATATVVSKYVWPEEGYLFDSLHRDGTPVRKVRPNALLAVSAGLLPPELARAVVARSIRDDLATDWGLRTLSSRDPTYDPLAYHDGRVWPIATAWAADAALAAGETELGLDLLDRQARRLVAEAGSAAECYRGDRPEPYDSCFLLGFSVAPFLTSLFARLWGIQASMPERMVRVEPTLPGSAGPATLRGLALGDGRLDLELGGGTLSATWDSATPIDLVSGRERVTLERGVRRSIACPAT